MRLWEPRVLGLDLSLTGTGIARLGETVELLTTVRPGKRVGHERLDYILAAIDDAQRGHHLDLVVIEGPSYGSQGGQQGHHERAGLWWLVSHSLFACRRPYAVVAPKARAKYGTGNGNDGKKAVTLAARELFGDRVEIRNDNEADAILLAHMGVDHLGGRLADVPEVNRQALRKVQWPETPADE